MTRRATLATMVVRVPVYGASRAEALRIGTTCPRCHMPRGPLYTYTGLGFPFDCWRNPCGHMDFYGDLWAEAEKDSR
jgi:hypothetical protein